MPIGARLVGTPHHRRRGGAASIVLLLLALVAAVAVVALLVRRGGTRETQVTGGATAGARAKPAPRGTRPSARSPAAGAAPNATASQGVTGDFEGCPLTGDGGDPELNRLKNRSFEGTYAPVRLDDLVALSWPAEVGGTARRRWSARARAQVASQETRAVSVEGYLIKARTSGPESTNCHGDAARYRDYHLWVAGAAGAGRERSLVVEMTPRLRALHSNWNLTVLNKVVSSRDRVRVSGWLLLDQEHPEQIGKTRGTVWEVHPVTRFEVQRNGRWLSLDDVAFARRAGGGR